MSTEAMELALEALEFSYPIAAEEWDQPLLVRNLKTLSNGCVAIDKIATAIDSLRAALAEQAGHKPLSDEQSHNGVTLRDYFAAHALVGLLVRNWANPATGKTPDNVHEMWAQGAYLTADAMLKERAK
jgi:hypothetical protein